MTKQFLKFILVGAASGFVNFAVYNLALLSLDLLAWEWQYGYLIAQLVGFYVSVLATFLLSRRFVFNSPAERAIPWGKALFRMYLVYSFTGVVVNSLLSILWVQVLGIPREAVSILNDVCAGPINFLLNKFWSFGSNKKADLAKYNS